MFEILLYFVVGAIAIVTLAVELYKWRINRKLEKFISPCDFPLLGFLAYGIFKTSQGATDMLNRVFLDQPDSVTAGKGWIGTQLLVTVTDPEDVKCVLMSDDCLDKPYPYTFFDSNDSLLSSKKELWRHDRRHLAPTLSIRMVARFLPILNAKAKKCAEIVSGSMSNTDFHRTFIKCVMDMHFAALFGVDCDTQSACGDILHDCLMTTTKHYQLRMFTPWFIWEPIYKLTKSYQQKQEAYVKLMNFVNNVAAKKSAELNLRLENDDSSSNYWNPLEKLFLMLRDGKTTEKILNDHAYILTSAASDSTATTTYIVLLMLAIHPDVQEKVVNELRQIFSSVDAPVTLEDCVRMEYTEMVIKESMRLFAPAPLMARQLSAEVTTKSGTLPSGTIVFLYANKIHRQERNWGPRANEFYPEHFSAENLEHQHPFTFVGFSAGARNCIGAKYAMVVLKVMLAHFLRRYRFSSDLKLSDIRTELAIVLKILNEKPFRCENRSFP